MKQNTSHIEKELWKLSEEIIKWPPYVNRTRKLLVETVNQIELKSNKIINIWIEAKKAIKKIGIEDK